MVIFSSSVDLNEVLIRQVTGWFDQYSICESLLNIIKYIAYRRGVVEVVVGIIELFSNCYDIILAGLYFALSTSHKQEHMKSI